MIISITDIHFTSSAAGQHTHLHLSFTIPRLIITQLFNLSCPLSVFQESIVPFSFSKHLFCVNICSNAVSILRNLPLNWDSTLPTQIQYEAGQVSSDSAW
jgi:hypothetical protein